MKPIYLENFSTAEGVLHEFGAPKDALDKAKVLIAWYGYGDYCGSAFVLFERDGTLFEVNGSHCSCYGIEDQWSPEETSVEALEKREWSAYDGSEKANEAVKSVIRTLKRRKTQ